ncbi:MAG: DEAD/DEAH box helicase [Clostridiales bacterium]|nr:DEAD/DEAH box helicase [Clostridiales bacterium]
MSENVFNYYAPFIQDYIYSHGWNSLHPVQVEAAKVLFETENNLLLCSGTASGKTEAAFFPILSMMTQQPPKSIGCLYIAPLKSLINDQFERMSDLLDESGIKVIHWHGDVAMSQKNKILKDPSGILQITPESLESMLMNRSNDIVRLFGDLRFIVIDEMHILTGSDRGSQIICQLCRIGRLIGYHPRRIGLSATLGDVRVAALWLGAGSGRDTDAPAIPVGKLTWRLGLEHFFINNSNANQTDDFVKDLYLNENGNALLNGDSPEEIDPETGLPVIYDTEPAAIDPGYEYIYDCTKGRKCLVFSNSREETEYITQTLRQIAENRGEPDLFNIHHGFLSSSIREEAELMLKDDDIQNVTCATVTLELGIDIGRLERVIQLESPHSVSSFLQRLGRSGRRGAPPEMMMVFREDYPLPNTPLPQLIPWELLRAIAVIQLYIEERFIEPPRIKKLPFSLMFHQTLSCIASSGALTAGRLADTIMNLPVFSGVSKEDYKTLLLAMLQRNFIEITDENEIIIGMKGERLINSFKFYAVFKDTDDYTVRCESDEIGIITTPPPVGDRFALAGRVWEVTELDIPRKLIFVKKVRGKMEISWPGDYGEIDTRILERMKQVLTEDTVYPYLKQNAVRRLDMARAVARNTDMLKHAVVHLGGFNYVLFPWLGTRSFRTMRKFLGANGAPLRISNIEYEGCCYITFHMEDGDERELIEHLCEIAETEGVDCDKLSGGDIPLFEKYDDCLPDELLHKAYAADRLRSDEVIKRLRQFRAEYEN